MIMFLSLLFTVKCEITTHVQNRFNESIRCNNSFLFINSIFFNIHAPLIDNCPSRKSISFSYCSFSDVLCITDSNYKNDYNNFTFDHNCCYNYEEKPNQSYICFQSNSCQIKWNTFFNFIGNSDFNFLRFDSPNISITNLNLSNSSNFDKYIFINSNDHLDQANGILQFNDATFDKVGSNYHIYINGPYNNYSIDRINDNGDSKYVFMYIKGCQFVITRVYLSNNMEIKPNDGFIWFVDSYIANKEPNLDGVPKPGSVVIDSTSSVSSSYFINHLSNAECQTNNIKLVDPPPHTVGKSMKIKIAFSFIGGALFGVVVFLILYFTIKYSIKCYQKKKDKEHPVFDL